MLVENAGLATASNDDPQLGAVAVVGLGYVGLPTALALHRTGVKVIGVDVSSSRLLQIMQGEPDLLPLDHEQLVTARQDAARFQVTSNMWELGEADAIIVCVPTPVDEALAPDMTALRAACEQVVAVVRPGATVILTSTSYVGCTRDLVEDPLRRRGLRPGEDVYVSFSPERIDPGNTDFTQSAVPRVVGGSTAACTEQAAAVVSRISGAVHRVSSMEVAELAKLLENTFRAVNISLANEIADAAHHFGIDPIEVIAAAATKPFGFMPFFPGPGVGGHCIPCDPHYLLWQLRRERIHPSVISAAMQSISVRPSRIVQRAAEAVELSGRTLASARVLVVGLTYKPDVSDIRESPALDIVDGLTRRGAEVTVYDPLVPRVTVRGRTYETPTTVRMEEFDLVVLCCRHSSMDTRDFQRARVVLDATYQLPEAVNRVVP